MSKITYEPFETLEVCSNKIVGGGYLLGVDGFAPLKIGKGAIPIIWLYEPTKHGWSPVVDENNSKRKEIAVLPMEDLGGIEIYHKSILMISASKISDDYCIVDRIDLRSIGLTIHGDKKSLFVAEKSFTKNSFKGVNFMIGIITEQRKK